MNIESILTPERTSVGIRATSRKKALEEVSALMAPAVPGTTATEIFDHLIARERLGSTAIGSGIALPHCRMKKCGRSFGGLFRLESPVDFDALDGEGVRILFVLLVPDTNADEHVRTLGMLAERMSNESYRNSLLTATSDRDLYESALLPPMSDAESASA